MALSRSVTALDNERFTVQSVMLKLAVPIVLVRPIDELLSVTRLGPLRFQVAGAIAFDYNFL